MEEIKKEQEALDYARWLQDNIMDLDHDPESGCMYGIPDSPDSYIKDCECEWGYFIDQFTKANRINHERDK